MAHLKILAPIKQDEFKRRAYSKQDIREMYKALHEWKIAALKNATKKEDDKDKIELVSVLGKAMLDPFWEYQQNPPKKKAKAMNSQHNTSSTADISTKLNSANDSEDSSSYADVNSNANPEHDSIEITQRFDEARKLSKNITEKIGTQLQTFSDTFFSQGGTEKGQPPIALVGNSSPLAANGP